MQPEFGPALADLANELTKVRRAFLEKLWTGFFVVALIAPVFSLSRIYFTGWKPFYGIQVLVALIVIVLYPVRDRIPNNVKSIILLTLMWVIGLSGLFTLGLMASGIWWLVLSCVVTTTIYSPKMGYATALATALALGAAGLGFSTGFLTAGVDADDYLAQPTSWFSLIVSTGLFAVVILRSTNVFSHSMVGLVQEVRRQRDEIARLATHDQLTGLPLMRLAEDRLQVSIHQARRAQSKIGILFVDLDGFKAVNDTHGHDAGDYVLKQIGQRMSATVRAGDTVARVGGDEFIVILPNLPDRTKAGEIAQTLIAVASAGIPYEDAVLNVGASVGVSIFPDDADAPNALRKLADNAMYRVKKSGKGRVGFAATA